MRTDGAAAPAQAPLIVWFGDPLSTDPSLVGHKTAHLSALSSHYPVPNGFGITAEAHRLCAESGSVVAGLREAIAAAYTILAPSGAAVAVRSSAVDEDSPDSSFAGQHATSLNVAGVDAVIAALEATWRSATSDAALSYRHSRGLPTVGMSLAVLVQRQVRADASGVAFSVDPVTGDAGRVVVNATWGLGEGLVNGTVDPDRFLFDKATLALVAEELGDKERMTITSEVGTRVVSTPGFLRARPALSLEERNAVASLARDLESHQGWPVDIEFAIGADGLSLLQCRPITTPIESQQAVQVVETSADPEQNAAEDVA